MTDDLDTRYGRCPQGWARFVPSAIKPVATRVHRFPGQRRDDDLGWAPLLIKGVRRPRQARRLVPVSVAVEH